MNDWRVTFIQVIGMNQTFKGGLVASVGLLVLLFAWWMHKRWREPLKLPFLAFIGFALFVTLFGTYILIFQPMWWKLPY